MATVLALPWPYLCWNLFNRIHLKSIVNCRAVTLPAAAVVVLKGERGVGGDGEAGLRAAVVHDHEAVLGGRQVERLLERAGILNSHLWAIRNDSFLSKIYWISYRKSCI